jgi:hypothetical protein
VQETNPVIAGVIARDDALPDFDVQCPLFSLPRSFGTTIETIPGALVPVSAAIPTTPGRRSGERG